jgi:hypothetical protein
MAATKTRTTRTPKKEAPAAAEKVEVTAEAEVETVEEPKKRGRKPSPLLAATKRFEKAERDYVKAKAALEKVRPLADAVNAARVEYEAARSELRSFTSHVDSE